MSDDQFYTVKHAAEYLRVSSGTIRRWDTEGKLVAQRHPVNRYRVYHVKDLEEIRKELSQGGTRYVPAEVRRLIEFYSGKTCEECGRRIDGAALLRHIDHIIPFTKGGQTVGINLRQLCHECNLVKAAHLDPAAMRRLELMENRREEIKDFFQKTKPFIVGNEKLREPQILAYDHLQQYFSGQPHLPAIVEIPTGCGKTGIICLAPFGLAKGRILVVTPGLIVRDELTKALSSLSSAENFYMKTEVFTDARHLPKVTVLKRGEAASQEDCIRADIIIANIHQASIYTRYFPEDFFNVIVADEGHHTPAESWQRITEAFPHAMQIYLTATPFRSDGREIEGTAVYRYRLADAIANKYVKNIVKVDAVPTRLTFVTADGEREYTTEEILAMREEEWFSRGVALSAASNISIIDKALDILFEKRKRGLPHQIIAAACSIDHAQRLVALFGTRGIRTTYVTSEMLLDEREKNLRDFETGKYDCIVHVGMLGEGYDHPPLSVAAVFRPYRTRLPYEQFIGRTLRIIPGGSEEDNIAHVVSHIGLNLDDLWVYFKNEIRDAQSFHDFDNYEDILEDVEDGQGGDDIHNRPLIPHVSGEEIGRFDIDQFLPIDDQRRHVLAEKLPQIEKQLDEIRRAGFQLPDLMTDFRRKLIELNAPLETRVVILESNRPDLERQQFKGYLNASEKRVAAYILNNLNIDPDFNLAPVLGKGEEKNNYEVLIRLVHRTLNEAMSKDGSRSMRNKWEIEEYRVALGKLDTLQDVLLEEARSKIQKTLRE